MTASDGGMLSISAFCGGPWSLMPRGVLPQHTSRRRPMEITLSGRVSTHRQHQAQTIEHQLERRHTSVAAHPEWPLTEEHRYRDDGDRGAQLNRPGLDGLRDRAAMAAFERVLMTAPDRWARHEVPPVLRLDELAQRGGQVEC